MLLRLCLIAVSAAVLGTLPRAEGYTWPAIRYSPPNACGKNETFDQNSFVDFIRPRFSLQCVTQSWK